MAGLEFEPTPQYLSSFHWFFSLYVIFPKEKILLIIDKLLGNFYTVQPLDVMWVKVTQLCPTLCNPTDYTIHGILQAGILEWVAFPFSRGSSQPRDQTQVSCMAGRFFTSWATREAQESWSGQEPTCQCTRSKKHGFNPLVSKILWRRTWQPTPAFLPRESPWTEEPSRLQSVEPQRVRHDWATLSFMELLIANSTCKCPL